MFYENKKLYILYEDSIFSTPTHRKGNSKKKRENGSHRCDLQIFSFIQPSERLKKKIP